MIDSHCHLDRIDLTPFQNSFDVFMQDALRNGMERMLCIAIDLENYIPMRQLVASYDQISLSVGVHPNVTEGEEPDVERLMQLAKDPKVIAIGETGLDYFRSEGDLKWQHDRFIRHIDVAKQLNKPLVIHTREAGQDALDILQSEGADSVGGIIHCFTEDWAYAKRAMDLNFRISFSGIVTFNNAKSIQEVAMKIPSDQYLVETDSPYLAPVPHRGKPNYPQYVQHVIDAIARLRGCSSDLVRQESSSNFLRLFANSF